MRMQVGDKVLVASHHVGRPPRRGRITKLPGSGTPHFWVRWESGSESLYFPDADCVVLCADGGHQFVGAPDPMAVHDPGTDPSAPNAVHRSASAQVWFDEDERHTEARVTIQFRDVELTGFGLANRNPHDPNLPAVGEELAAARALSDLAHQLLDLAGLHIEHHAGHPVHVEL
jgi:hypothetical protein